MNRIYSATLLASTMALLGLASCGGGASGSAATVAPSTRPILTTTLRTVNNGDFIQYNIAGTIFAGGVTSSVTGTASSAFSTNASPLDPSGLRQSTTTVSMTGTLTNGAQFTSNATTYVSQDAGGSLFLHGNSTGGWITAPASGFIPGLISPDCCACQPGEQLYPAKWRHHQ